jgi:succinyl-diaminopimelate desuccinylase
MWCRPVTWGFGRVIHGRCESTAPPTDPEAPVAVAITRAMKQLRRRTPKPLGIGGGTVAKFFRRAGYPCVVWCTMDDRVHTPDEYVRIPHILDDARVFAYVALQPVDK